MKALPAPGLSPSFSCCEKGMALIKNNAIEAFDRRYKPIWTKNAFVRPEEGELPGERNFHQSVLDLVKISVIDQLLHARVIVRYISCILSVFVQLINWQRLIGYLWPKWIKIKTVHQELKLARVNYSNKNYVQIFNIHTENLFKELNTFSCVKGFD